ncbi:unnamed protein product [Moneuplotes crassus]|uniref:UBA domain-containing protein n=1 Tax=Euplotes crassus TaxID=5936 RepID=A0AAD1XYD7_EUPCR|nr:unnamed protein product [Moneuplotes crassus]
MVKLLIKKIKFSNIQDANGTPFGTKVDQINVTLSDKCSTVLSNLKDQWSQTCPQMVAWIEDSDKLKLMLTGKIIDWNNTFADYAKIKEGTTLILMHKSPPKEAIASAQKTIGDDSESKDMDIDAPKDSEKVVPLLERVEEEDIDRNAMNQLIMLGYDKNLIKIALRKVGTEYGSLGYDGLNKAIDWIHKKMLEDEQKLLPKPQEVKKTKKELEEEKQNDRLELIRRASSEAKKRYKNLENRMDNRSTNISIDCQNISNVYSFGKGSKGQLGLGEHCLLTCFPTKIRELSGVRINKVVCGPRNTLFLSGDNHLFKTNMATCKPQRIFKRELAHLKIVDIAAGSSHFMVLNDEGHVFSWGDNDCGQLGIGEGAKQNIPKRIESLKRIFINRISCGAVHSMALSKTGNVFVWGSNIRGQLGYDPQSCKQLPTPTKVCLMLIDSNDEEIKEEVIPRQSQDTIMNDEEEKIPEFEIPAEPALNKNETLDLVTHGVCGTWSSIFVTESSKIRLHVWGGEEEIINSSYILYQNQKEGNSIKYLKSRGDVILYINKLGELYEYSIKNKNVKYIEQLPRFSDLSMGTKYIGIVHHDNTLHMKGLNKDGQLGTGDKENRLENFEQITSLEPTRIDKITCGLSNTCLISKQEETKMDINMAKVIFKRLFKSNDSKITDKMFKDNQNLEDLLMLIIQHIGSKSFNYTNSSSKILSDIIEECEMPDITDTSKIQHLIQQLKELAHLVVNWGMSNKKYEAVIIKVIDSLTARLARLIEIRARYHPEEEEEDIKEFEMERIKQELEMRGQSAQNQAEQRMADYRRRVRDEAGHDNPDPNELPRGPQPFQEEMIDEDISDQEHSNQDEFEGEGEEYQDPTPPPQSTGIRLGNSESEELDPKEARLKWLENLKKK